MKVLVCPADVAGCGFYRLIFAAQHLRMLGHDVQIDWPSEQNGLKLHWRGNELVDCLPPIDDVDVLVVQRVSHDWHVQALPMLRQKGIAVVVDMDDNLSLIHRDNSAYWNYHPRSTTPYSHKNAETICRDATLVTVSTNNLLRVYAKHGRGMVLDNYVPERYLSVSQTQEEHPVFGWMGTLQSHPADLQACGKAVQELINQGYKFRIIGPGTGVQKQLKLEKEPDATGRFEFLMCPIETAKLNVGMAPLESSYFNSGKSRLKLLEYASLSIPYVASPREEYRKFHRESGGAGFLAETPKEWSRGLKTLLDDDVLRKELGQRARAFAETQTVERNAWRFWEAWTRAYEIEHGVSK